MDPERWSQLRELFDAAVERPAAERARFLDLKTAGDPALRRDIEAMMAEDQLPGGPLEHLFSEGERRRARGELTAGASLGAYRLIREIGDGGTSTVFLAVRDDDPAQEKVAIKVLTSGLDRSDLLRRFHTERRILASLDHPHIAKFHDGGATADGVPYLVMEYVEGVPIDEYCDGQRLPISQRLELFLKVCAAVQSAHQSLVVHRDIKPRNILVTAAGAPKLLDFGIAKLLDPEGVPGDVERTRTGQRLLTPFYASPEQARGGPITTASDVYSLGVVLYRLLSGHLPYESRPWESQGFDPAFAEEPERPSFAIALTSEIVSPADGSAARVTPESVSRARGASPSRVQSQLAGDLDAIALRALARDPRRRYGSVAQLSDDLQRHLAGLPVRAQRASFAYRTAKFVRRHRVATLAAAAILAAVLGFAASAVWQADRIAQERDIAQRERDRAQQVAVFLEDLFSLADPATATGETITAKEILDRGAQRVVAELQDQPEVQANLMATIGNVYRNLALYDASQEMLEAALSVRRRALGNDHPAVARSLNDLAVLLHARGRFQAARPLLEEALAVQRRAYGEDHLELAITLSNQAAIQRAVGDYDGAESLYRQALELRRKLLGDDDPALAELIEAVAVVAQDKGDYAVAEKLYRRVLDLRQRHLGATHPEVLQTQSNLATALAELGEADAAEALFREVLQHRRRLLGEDHPDVALSLHNLAVILQDRGEMEAAETLFRQALEIRLRVQGERHPDVAWAVHSLAVLLHENQDPQAEPMLRRALELGRLSMGEEHPLVAYTLITLGRSLMERGELTEAEPMLREGLGIWRRGLPAGDWRTAVAASTLGACLTRQGRLTEAEPLLVESYPIIKAQRGSEDEHTRRVRTWLGELRRATGSPGEHSG